MKNLLIQLAIFFTAVLALGLCLRANREERLRWIWLEAWLVHVIIFYGYILYCQGAYWIEHGFFAITMEALCFPAWVTFWSSVLRLHGVIAALSRAYYGIWRKKNGK